VEDGGGAAIFNEVVRLPEFDRDLKRLLKIYKTLTGAGTRAIAGV
jgi:hypothetical protein